MRRPGRFPRIAVGVATWLLAAALVVVFVFPFFWMVLTSLKTRVEALDPSVWIFHPTLDNYASVFDERNLGLFLTNSVLIVAGTTALALVLSLGAAYGFARGRFRGKENLAFWILSLRMLPAIATVLPFFLLGRFIGLLDTHSLLIIVYLSFNVPFGIWMLRGFIEEVPIELEEAAWLDGASVWSTLFRVVVPLIAPGLAATAVFTIIQSWNEFTLALFLTTVNARTLPTTVLFFLSVSGVEWGGMAAVGSISTIPVVLFALTVQRHMTRGLTFGSLKA